MAIELIVIAEAEAKAWVYGAVTIGNAWLFGHLDQAQKQITQDITLYRVTDGDYFGNSVSKF